MLQGLAHWMAYRGEFSNIQVIEADAVYQATDILRSRLPKDYVVEREVTKLSLPILVGKKRIDLGIKSLNDNSYACLIEFKLADATNEGYAGDIDKLHEIKKKDDSIDCLVVILWRKLCNVYMPNKLVSEKGRARRKSIYDGEKGDVPIKVRRVCTSLSTANSKHSKKVICLEVLQKVKNNLEHI